MKAQLVSELQNQCDEFVKNHGEWHTADRAHWSKEYILTKYSMSEAPARLMNVLQWD
jgi:hypothetical protein